MFVSRGQFDHWSRLQGEIDLFSRIVVVSNNQLREHLFLRWEQSIQRPSRSFIDNPSVGLCRFQVTYHFASATSFRALNFVIHRSSYNGSCSIHPLNGTTSTVFTISSPDWFDEDGIKDYSLQGYITIMSSLSLSPSLLNSPVSAWIWRAVNYTAHDGLFTHLHSFRSTSFRQWSNIIDQASSSHWRSSLFIDDAESICLLTALISWKQPSNEIEISSPNKHWPKTFLPWWHKRSLPSLQRDTFI